MPVVTWNPADADSSFIFSSGDLQVTVDGAGWNGWSSVRATYAYADTESRYFEVELTAGDGLVMIGVATSAPALDSSGFWSHAEGFGYYGANGEAYNGGSVAYGATFTAGDIIGVLLKNGKVYFAKNGVWQNSGDPDAETGYAFSGLSGDFFPILGDYSPGNEAVGRFALADLAYTLPTGAGAWDETASLLRTLNLSGFDATVFGDNEALLAERWLRTDGFDAASLGEPAATFWLQWVYTAVGDLTEINAPQMGDVRAVSPPWWYSTYFGNAFVGEYLTLSPSGWLGEFGEHDVRSNLQRIQPSAFQPTSVGTQRAELDDRHIPPLGGVQTLWGSNAVVPMLRTVQQIDGTQREHQGIGTAAVTPMTIAPTGLVAGVTADRVTVARSGQVIHTDGLVGAIGTQWVSWANRTLSLRGFEDFFCNEWHHARNAARVLSPTGFDAIQFGAGEARNELRFVQHNYAAGPQAFGAGWVSFAERGISITEGPPTPMPPAPAVQQWEQYVRPAGYMRAPTDRHEVRGHQNRISPDRTVPSTLYGTAGVVNEDREVRANGADPAPHGRATVWRDPEYLITGGVDQALFGPAYVHDSLQTVNVAPATLGEVPTTHWLRNELPDPPRLQRIGASAIDESTMGAPDVSEYGISANGIASQALGTPTVVGNGIRPPGIPPPGYGAGGPVGVPSLPGLQTITFEPANSNEFLKMGAPRLSPAYLVPAELIDNWFAGPSEARPAFGGAVVMHIDRTIMAMQPYVGAHGQTAATLFERTLPLIGPRFFRSGFPICNGAADIVTHGRDAALFGDSIVGPPVVIGDQTLSPSAHDAGEFGATEAQNQHRTIVASAGETNLGGEVWISHQYEPFVMDPLRATLWGDALVQYADREITDVGGTELLDMTPYPGWSQDRMRLRSVSYIAVAPGSVHGAVGVPTIESHHRRIGVNGIERPQFQVPEGGRVRGESQVAPASLDAVVLGDPRMWEPGDDLYPYAEDMLTIGEARMIGVVQPTGFEALLMGDIRTAVPVEPAGEELAEWGSTVVVHEGGGRICNSYMPLAMALAALDAGAIGSHEVAHDP